jgi:enediyne biosynthesis protein E4
LYHNLGNGKFEDVTEKAHIDETTGHYSFSVSTLDFDNDGWPDIYVACDSTPSILYRNNRDGTFTDVAVLAGAAFNEDGKEQAGMGSTIADLDGDGKLDISRRISPTTLRRCIGTTEMDF